MQDAEVIPLRLIERQVRLYVNLSGDAKDVLIWAATHRASGEIRAGADHVPAHRIETTDGTVFLKVSVAANESVVAIPGTDGVMAVRLVQV
jgi:hypothetical protein